MSDTIYIVGSNFHTGTTSFSYDAPSCDDTVLHLQSDTWDKSGNYNNTITNNVVYSNDNKLFSFGSLKFAGDASLIVDDADETFDWIHDKTIDRWTIETWFRLEDSVTGVMPMFGTSDSSHDTGFRMVCDNGRLVFLIDRGTPGVHSFRTVINKRIKRNRWYHVAVVRTGETIQTWLDGVKETDSVWYNSADTFNTSNRLTIGRTLDDTTPTYMNGDIQDFRIVKNHANYDSNNFEILELHKPCVDICMYVWLDYINWDDSLRWCDECVSNWIDKMFWNDDLTWCDE